MNKVGDVNCHNSDYNTKMIDTHAHLTTRLNPHDGQVKLDAVILAASSIEDSVENLEIAKKADNLFPSVGIHPGEVGENIDNQINYLDNLLSQYENIVAVGECGLELVEQYDLKNQTKLFRGQIALSLKHNKPLIVHSREASDEILKILADYKGLRGVIHCYTGGKKRIKKFLDLPGEWSFGLDGNLTYEAGLEQVAVMIPKDRLVAETDTPFLAPVPHRQCQYPVSGRSGQSLHRHLLARRDCDGRGWCGAPCALFHVPDRTEAHRHRVRYRGYRIGSAVAHVGHLFQRGRDPHCGLG